MEAAYVFARDLLERPPVLAALVVLASVVAARLVNFFISRLLLRVARSTESDLDDRLIGLLRRPVFLTVVLLGLYGALRILSPPPELQATLISAIQTVIILLWLLAALKICSTLIDWLGRVAGRVDWIEERTIPLFDNVAKILLVGGGIYLLLVAWRLDVKPWLASAGILGLAVGFAAKDTIANLFGGLFIIVDAPYKIGDFVNLDTGERGRVTKIGLRSTRLLTRDDVEITLPNAQIANSKIINESGGHWEKSRVAIQVGVAYGSDVDRVRQILIEAAASVDEVAPDPEPRVRFIEMGDSALIFRVLCWVDEPVLRGRCIDGLNTAVYKRLVAAGINIPFPQREIQIRRASRSDAAPSA